MYKPQEIQGAVMHQEAFDFIKELQAEDNSLLKSCIGNLTNAIDKLITLADLDSFDKETEHILANFVTLKKDLTAFSSKKGGELC